MNILREARMQWLRRVCEMSVDRVIVFLISRLVQVVDKLAIDTSETPPTSRFNQSAFANFVYFCVPANARLLFTTIIYEPIYYSWLLLSRLSVICTQN